jgi:hypothetical protein
MKKLIAVMVVVMGLMTACEMIDDAKKEVELWTADVECMENYDFENNIAIETEEIALSYVKKIKGISDKDAWEIEEYFQTPEETIYFKTGDCEDYALLLAYLLDRIGIESYLVHLTHNKKDHIILYYDNKYIEPQTGLEIIPDVKIDFYLPYCQAIYMAVTYHDFINWYRI